jgi:hypothetical protein
MQARPTSSVSAAAWAGGKPGKTEQETGKAVVSDLAPPRMDCEPHR